MYSVKELVLKTGKTEQTIYRLARENEEFRTIWEQSQTKIGNKKRYGEDVLTWLVNHYNLSSVAEQDVGASFYRASNGQIPQPTARQVESLIRDNEAFKGQIEALKRENELLRAQLDTAERREKEDKEILGHTLLCLQQATQAQRLLDTPKPSVFQRVKQLFSKPRAEQENN